MLNVITLRVTGARFDDKAELGPVGLDGLDEPPPHAAASSASDIQLFI
jgi:hypothetical protein